MNGVQTRFKCKLDVKRCKRFVFPPSSLLPRSNALKTKAIRYFQTDRTLTRIVSPPLQEKYLESSIYVMSSRFEGLPMALLEAMACGVPCISFDCPYGPAEIITPEEDGILVKNGNTDELADAICRLIEDTDKRIRMGKQAQKNIQRYSREEVMKLWDELFNTLTTARP